MDESKDRPLTPREEALAAIKQTRLEKFNEEIVEAGGEPIVFSADPNADPDDTTAADEAAEAARVAAQAARKPKPADAPAPTKTQAELDAEEAAKQTAGAPTDPATLVKVKVDGEEMEVPFSQVVANYQKTQAADKRLRDATQEADRIRREAAASPTSAPAPGPAPAGTPAPAGKSWTEALFAGDEDAADAAINDRIAAGVQEAIKALKLGGEKPTEDQRAEIVNSVTQQLALNSVLQQSRTDYPMLYSDPDVEAVGKSKIERRMAEGVPFVDALHAVETEMATKFGWTKTAATPTPAPARNRVSVDDRLDRKGAIDTLPTATARRTAETVAEPVMDERERASRGIAQLREGRPGQQQA